MTTEWTKASNTELELSVSGVGSANFTATDPSGLWTAGIAVDIGWLPQQAPTIGFSIKLNFREVPADKNLYTVYFEVPSTRQRESETIVSSVGVGDPTPFPNWRGSATLYFSPVQQIPSQSDPGSSPSLSWPWKLEITASGDPVVVSQRPAPPSGLRVDG